MEDFLTNIFILSDGTDNYLSVSGYLLLQIQADLFYWYSIMICTYEQESCLVIILWMQSKFMGDWIQSSSEKISLIQGGRESV